MATRQVGGQAGQLSAEAEDLEVLAALAAVVSVAVAPAATGRVVKKLTAQQRLDVYAWVVK